MKNKSFSIKAGAFCMIAIAGSLVVPTHAFAQDVTLKSADGTVNLTGEFIAFQDNSYIVRTPLGDLRIAASRVTCDGAACPVFGAVEADVQIAGSDTVGLGLMPLLLEGYAGFMDAAATINNSSGGTTLLAEFISDSGFGDALGSYSVESTQSSQAFSALLDGEAEIGMSSRRIRPDEARALRDAGGGIMVSPSQEHLIAVDTVVVITNPNNPVDTLTLEQMAQIYAGTITNWQEVGGPDLAITVVDRPLESGTRAVFDDVFANNAVTPNAVIVEDNVTASALVNEDEGAIGYVGYAFQRGAKALTMIDECGQPMTPNAFAARTEEYALQRRMYLYTRADADPEQVQSFVNYASSPAADGVIAKSGFIGLGIDRQLQSLESDRGQKLSDPDVDAFEAGFMRDMLDTMVDYDRLSTTFRFRAGSSSLDERGRVDMDRLIEYLETQPDGTEVLFVGFTDDVGAFESNMDLSRVRAGDVLAEVQSVAGSRLGNMNMSSAGYGAIAPAGCNLSEDGRQINRRVEVWIQSGSDTL